MNVQPTNPVGSVTPQTIQPKESIQIDRKKNTDEAFITVTPDNGQANGVQPEEILDRIKDLTDNGAYNIRFEMNNDVNKLVISLLDSESGELVRQIPPEELLGLAEILKDLRGNLVDSSS